MGYKEDPVEIPGFSMRKGMPPLKNVRQEKFTLSWFEGKTKEDSAVLAGYAPKWARSVGSRLSTNVNILGRLHELQQKAEDDSIAGVIERKQILTNIARAKITDYATCGPDGDLVMIGPESPHPGAIATITSRTEVDKDGAGVAVVTRIRLHDPEKAVDLLNKMDKLYGEGINIDARSIRIGEEGDDPKRALIEILDSVAARAREVQVAGQLNEKSDKET